MMYCCRAIRTISRRQLQWVLSIKPHKSSGRGPRSQPKALESVASQPSLSFSLDDVMFDYRSHGFCRNLLVKIYRRR
jgi:hypothetical protein